jgi:hypothetical protein
MDILDRVDESCGHQSGSRRPLCDSHTNLITTNCQSFVLSANFLRPKLFIHIRAFFCQRMSTLGQNFRAVVLMWNS